MTIFSPHRISDKEHDQQDHPAEKPPLLGKNGKDEIRLLFRQELELGLGSFQESLSEESPRTHGDHRLDDVVARSQRIPLGAEEGQNPFLLVIFQKIPADGRQDEAAGGGDQQRFPVQADKEDHRQKQDEEDQPRAQIGLLEDEQKRDHDDQERDEQFRQVVIPAELVAVEVFGQRQDDRQLDQLRRLEGEAADGDPPLGAPRRITGRKDDEEKDDGDAVDDIGMAAEKAVIDEEGDGHPDDADEDPLDLLDVERRLAEIGEAEPGAVDVEQADAADDQDQDEQGPVEVEDETAVQFDHGSLFSPTSAASLLLRPGVASFFSGQSRHR